jgi:hypothetical protein
MSVVSTPSLILLTEIKESTVIPQNNNKYNKTSVTPLLIEIKGIHNLL